MTSRRGFLGYCLSGAAVLSAGGTFAHAATGGLLVMPEAAKLEPKDVVLATDADLKMLGSRFVQAAEYRSTFNDREYTALYLTNGEVLLLPERAYGHYNHTTKQAE